MKAGWRVVPLGGVCRLINGKAYKQAELLEAGPYPVLRVGNFFTNNHWYYSDLELDADKYCDDGDLLYAWSASFGPRIWQGGKVIYHYHIWKVAPDLSKLDRDFLYYFFDWDKELIKKEQGAGTTMIHVSKGSMEARSIPLPPLDEQKRIVAVLDEAFEGLSRARANAEANLADARELFESTLRGVFHGVEQTAPKYTLAAVAQTFGRGKSRHRPRNDPKLYGGNFPFVQTGDIRNSDGFVTTFSQTYNELGLAQSKLWPEGTVCITIAANIAETAILGFPACFPDSIIGMVCDPEKTRPEYVELMLRYFAADLKEKGKGSAQDNINLATFEQSPFPIPNIPEQVRIVEQLSEIAQERRNLEAQFLDLITKLDTLRQSILQKAFSGELT